MTSLERAARAGKTPSGSCYCVWWNSAGDTPSRPSCLLGQDYAVSPVVSRPGRKFKRCQHPSPSDCPAHQRHTLFFPVHQEVPKTLQWGPGLTVGLCTGSCTGGQQTFPRTMTGGPEGGLLLGLKIVVHGQAPHVTSCPLPLQRRAQVAHMGIGRAGRDPKTCGTSLGRCRRRRSLEHTQRPQGRGVEELG